MPNTNKSITAAAVAATLASVLTMSLPVQAGDAGAFVGGMLAGKVMHNMHERTEAEKAQAYYAQQQSQQQQVQQAAPASSGGSTQQKLDELDKLAAGGYITPEEYKAKKQSIIDAM